MILILIEDTHKTLPTPPLKKKIEIRKSGHCKQSDGTVELKKCEGIGTGIGREGERGNEGGREGE